MINCRIIRCIHYGIENWQENFLRIPAFLKYNIVYLIIDRNLKSH